MSKRVMQKRATAALAAMAFAVIFGSGCAAPPAPVTLQYQLAERESVSTRILGGPIGVVPFQDGRTDPYLYRRALVLAEGQDAGVWVANALRLELAHAGATVEALPAGGAPTTGRVLTGQVALLKAQATGWHLGGVIAALIGTGYMPHITVRAQLYDEGVPVLTRQYDLQKNVPSDPGHVLLFGFPPAHRDVPAAFGIVLKKLIREQIMPDLAKVLGDVPVTSVADTLNE